MSEMRWKNISVLDDKDLDGALGGEHDFDLPAGDVVFGVQQLVNLGTLDTGSYNADAEYDLFDRIKLMLNGKEYFDVTGPMLNFLNAYQSGVSSNTPLEYSFGHRGNGNVIGAIPVDEFTSAKLQYELDDVSNISGGTSQSGTEIKTSGLVNPTGTLKRLRTYQYHQWSFSSTGEKKQEINEFGRLTGLVINENDATVDHVTAVTKDDNGKQELVDLDFDEIRARNERDSGVSSLPAGWIWVPLQEHPKFANKNVVRLELDVSAVGTVEYFPRIDGTVGS